MSSMTYKDKKRKTDHPVIFPDNDEEKLNDTCG